MFKNEIRDNILKKKKILIGAPLFFREFFWHFENNIFYLFSRVLFNDNYLKYRIRLQFETPIKHFEDAMSDYGYWVLKRWDKRDEYY